ncbi:MAG TPA: hypothetical protein VJ901_11030 [Thermoanaerobaculia bacterium]|nr:hypothetical protein [Thermoanaerobaculia bacterium]
MKRLSLAVLVTVISLAAFAAEPPKPQLYSLYEEVVNPSMMTQYEGATKDLVKALGEKKLTSASFVVNTYMTSDFHYLYMTPIASWAQLDTIDNDWRELKEKIGAERWTDIQKRGNGAMSSYDSAIIARRDELSYRPETPRLPEEREPFARLEFYYLKPGAEEQAEQVAKDYVTLFKEKKIADGFSIYTALSGHDLPVLVAVIPAQSPADFAAADERNTAALGDALRTLQGRAMSLTRRIERKDVWFRPDLSYMAR